MLKSILTLMISTVLTALATPAFAQNAFGHVQTFSTSRELATADAQALVALPGSLHETMKAMKDVLKQIDSADGSKNAANARLADQFVALVLHAKAFTPDHVDAAGKAKYDALLDQTAATGRSLAAAFRAGDNAKATQLMSQLNAEKKDGHGQFK